MKGSKFLILSVILMTLIGMAGADIFSMWENTAYTDTPISSSSTVSAEQLTSTDDATVTDDLGVGGDLAVTGAISAGTGTISSGVYDGDFRLAAGHDFLSTSGAGYFNWSMATGMFNTSTGTNYINGNIIVATLKNLTMQGASTITTGTGAIALNGDTTLASSKTLAVTTADKLTVGGVIVPQAITIPVQLDSSSANGTVFIPISGNYQVLGISEAHSVAASTTPATTATIVKVTGTQAPATAGVVVISNTFNLKGTAETVQNGTLSTVSGATKVNTTERLGIRFNNPLTALAGGCVSISLKRIA